jgi:hypothetical protein
METAPGRTAFIATTLQHRCDHKIARMDMIEANVVRAGVRVLLALVASVSFHWQAVATFMLVRGERYFFGLDASNSYNATTAALLLSDFGAPLGNMTVAGSVASREYTKATVSLDCATFTASFTPASA